VGHEALWRSFTDSIPDMSLRHVRMAK
jgi:hypothetical protein